MRYYAVKHSKTIAVLLILQIKYLHINTATIVGFYSLFQALLLHYRVLQLKLIFISLKLIPQQIMFLSTWELYNYNEATERSPMDYGEG